MPKIVPQTEMRQIAQIIAQFGRVGSPIGELLKHSGLVSYSKRTLQRRLDQLTKSGDIVSVGQGRGRRYVAKQALKNNAAFQPNPSAYIYPDSFPDVESPFQIPEPTDDESLGNSKAWMSAAAAEIKQGVSRPVSERTPVGYQERLLQDYVPNETAYIDFELRKKLERVGKVGMTDLPPGTYLRQVLSRLCIDLSWNSSRLEGNTYSRLETQRLLELGEIAEGKTVRDAQMILNHKSAIEFLAEQPGEIGFNRYTLLNLHALLADNLMSDRDMCGQLRFRAVGIGGSVYYPLEGPHRIESCFSEILSKADAISDPFEQAFFVMVQLPYLQPFEDANKRVSRLVANIPLIRHNLCPLSFVDVNHDDYVSGLLGVYELNRVELLRDVFARAFERSAVRYSAIRNTLGDPDPFRFRNRALISNCVRHAVLNGWAPSGSESKVQIAGWADEHVVETDRQTFATVIGIELRSLHPGNFARFKIRPAEFAAWNQSREA